MQKKIKFTKTHLCPGVCRAMPYWKNENNCNDLPSFEHLQAWNKTKQNNLGYNQTYNTNQ
jgi:hypothetical protein